MTKRHSSSPAIFSAERHAVSPREALASTIAWDIVGQVMTQSAGRGVADLAGLTSMRAPPASDTAERHYAWDNAGAPTGIDDSIWRETRYTYDANGQVAEASFGDGFTEKFDYDAAKSVAGVSLQGPEISPRLDGLLSWQSTPGGVVQMARGSDFRDSGRMSKAACTTISIVFLTLLPVNIFRVIR